MPRRAVRRNLVHCGHDCGGRIGEDRVITVSFINFVIELEVSDLKVVGAAYVISITLALAAFSSLEDGR